MNYWAALSGIKSVCTPILAGEPPRKPSRAPWARWTKDGQPSKPSRCLPPTCWKAQKWSSNPPKSCRAVREAVGDEVDILLDFHGRVTPQMAIQFAKAFEPYHPLFIEEPVPAEVPEAMAQVKRATSIPIATGERLFTRWGFRRILETEAASLLQPDACHAGGIGEVRKIGAMAEAYYAGLAPHNPYGPVSTAACIQVDFAAPNFVIQEIVDPEDIPEAMTFVKEPLPIVDGYILPPDKPGIGVEVDEAACAKRKPDFSVDNVRKQIAWFREYHPDGGIADW